MFGHLKKGVINLSKMEPEANWEMKKARILPRKCPWHLFRLNGNN